jgi:hypothetical protein
MREQEKNHLVLISRGDRTSWQDRRSIRIGADRFICLEIELINKLTKLTKITVYKTSLPWLVLRKHCTLLSSKSLNSSLLLPLSRPNYDDRVIYVFLRFDCWYDANYAFARMCLATYQQGWYGMWPFWTFKLCLKELSREHSPSLFS